MIQDDCKGLIDYCKTLKATLSAPKKKKATFEDGFKSPRGETVKSERKPPIGSKKWRQLVDSMAPGHPVPPKLYGLFRAKVKERKIKDKELIKQMWSNAEDPVKNEAEAEFAALNTQYKVWLFLSITRTVKKPSKK